MKLSITASILFLSIFLTVFMAKQHTQRAFYGGLIGKTPVQYTLTGTVFVENTKAVLQGVTITIKQNGKLYQTQTNQKGIYKIDVGNDLSKNGETEIDADLPKFIGQKHIGNIQLPMKLDFYMPLADSKVISGKVSFDKDVGGGIKLVLYSKGSSYLQPLKTDYSDPFEGVYEFDGYDLIAGSYSIVALYQQKPISSIYNVRLANNYGEKLKKDISLSSLPKLTHTVHIVTFESWDTDDSMAGDPLAGV